MTAELTVGHGKKSCKDGFILAKFSNARLQDDRGMRFGLFQDTDSSNRKRKRKQFVAETDKMTYVGKNYGAYAAAENDYAKYFVGVFDKKTNKVRVYNSEIFLLHPHFPDDKNKDKDEVDAGLSFRAKVDALTEAFGVGKKKKAMSKRQQVMIDSKGMDSAMQSAVALARKEPSITADPVSQDDPSGSIVPPHHKDATKPQEAYLIEDLITTEEIEALKSPAQVFANSTLKELNEMLDQNKICSFVLAQLKVLPVTPEARIQKACIITYLQYLVNLFKLKAQDVKRKDFLSEDMPGLIKKKITNEFCVFGRGARRATPVRCMPTKMKDKVLLHILVLGLILEDFNMEYSALLTDLKITPMRMTKTLKVLGCSSKNQVIKEPGVAKMSLKLATLPIPLVFPTVRSPKKKSSS